MRKHAYSFLIYNITFFIIASIIGVLCGFSSVILRKLIIFIRSILLNSNNSSISAIVSTIPKYEIIFNITICGLLVGIITYFFAKEAKGYGVMDVIIAVRRDKSIMKPRIIFIKIITTALTIASGGSAGEQGPIVQIGAAIGSSFGQIFKLTEKKLKILLACGAASGIAAAFNAPIAGMIFALDVILGEFKMLNISAVIISSVTATMISWTYLGNSHVFNVSELDIYGHYDMLFAIFIGISCASAGHLFFKILTGFENVFEKIKVHYILKPAIGYFLTGVIIIFIPQVYGGGYDVMNNMIIGNISLLLIISLAFIKILSTSLTLGSGGSGGLFAPSIFIGGAIGSAIGIIIINLFPHISSPLGVYVLLGMAGVISAIMHSPLTAFLIIFEMTNNYHIILPLMITVVLASLISLFYSPYSAYTKKLPEKGIKIYSSKDEKILNSILVYECMTKDFISFNENMTFNEISYNIYHQSQLCFPVLNNNNKLRGTIMISQIIENINNGNGNKKIKEFIDNIVDDIIKITYDQTLDKAIVFLNRSNLSNLPVVKNGILIGIIRQKDILKVYRQTIYESL